MTRSKGTTTATRSHRNEPDATTGGTGAAVPDDTRSWAKAANGTQIRQNATADTDAGREVRSERITSAIGVELGKKGRGYVSSMAGAHVVGVGRNAATAVSVSGAMAPTG